MHVYVAHFLFISTENFISISFISIDIFHYSVKDLKFQNISFVSDKKKNIIIIFNGIMSCSANWKKINDFHPLQTLKNKINKLDNKRTGDPPCADPDPPRLSLISCEDKTRDKNT